MKHVKAYILTALLAGVFYSCLDETLEYTRYPSGIPDTESGDRDMRLKVSVPKTYSAGAAGSIDREERIDTLDVLVFAPAAGNPDKKYLRSAVTGSVVKDDEGNVVKNVFEVVMPLGKDMDVHVFANAHSDLVRHGAFGASGKEMQSVLGSITTARKYDIQEADVMLPMHGSVTGITIDKDSKDVLPVSVLRSVSKVSVMINGSVSASSDELMGGELDEFKLYEMYVFFPADSARVATADTTQFYTVRPDSGNVKTATLPAKLRAGNRPDSISIKSTTVVKQIESIYLYENIPWSKDGFDYATSRMVLGGVFYDKTTGSPDKNADGTPRISYYRINFQDNKDVQYPLLRNHHYVFSITSVAAPGYDTPRQAAEGKPINIQVTVFDWMNELHEIVNDGQHYFNTSSKNIILPRDANSIRSIEVESDVDASEWKMYFKDANNGETTPKTWFKDKSGNDSIDATAGATLQNSRYKVTKADDKITVEVLKKYSDLPPAPSTESRDDVLVLMVKNLRIYIHISQADKSPDDWGNGGDLNTDLGEDPNKPLDVGLPFYVAKGNLIATKQADGSLSYAFADEQGYYSEKVDGGDLFCWNTDNPFTLEVTQSSWEDARDPCRKVGDGKWRTPTDAELQALIDTGNVWGENIYTMKDGTTKNGGYFGTTTVPAKADQDKYVFLPAAGGRRYGNSYYDAGTSSYCWSATLYTSHPNFAYTLKFNSSDCCVINLDRSYGRSLRCVHDK